MGDHTGAAYVMHGLAQVKLEEDELGEAAEPLSKAWRLCHKAKYARLEAQLLHRRGEVQPWSPGAVSRDYPEAD
jgi:hypothetical protein